MSATVEPTNEGVNRALEWSLIKDIDEATNVPDLGERRLDDDALEDGGGGGDVGRHDVTVVVL